SGRHAGLLTTPQLKHVGVCDSMNSVALPASAACLTEVLLMRTALLAGLVAVSVSSAEPAKVGFAVENFTLKDYSGKTFSLAGCRDSKAVVVVFLGTECPINNAFVPVLSDLHRNYAEKGVQLIAINANRQDTPQRIAAHVKKYGIAFPVLKDT